MENVHSSAGVDFTRTDADVTVGSHSPSKRVSGRPPKPAREALRDTPAKSPLDRIRYDVKSLAVDTFGRAGTRLGLLPSRSHVVICGFPRAGTTLLHLMVQTSIPDILAFRRERFGLFVARTVWPRRHQFVVTKRPADIFWVDEIRAHYAARAPHSKVHFVVCTRDPRAILTSRHANRAGYYVDVEWWRAIYEHLRYVRSFADVTVVDFRDIVSNTAAVQQQLTDLVGWTPATSFADFHAQVPAGFDTSALNGVRGLDARTLDKWAGDEHRERIRALLEEMPDLPDRLVEMGYEADARWTLRYR